MTSFFKVAVMTLFAASVLTACGSTPPKYDDRAERKAEKSQDELKQYEKEAMQKN